MKLLVFSHIFAKMLPVVINNTAAGLIGLNVDAKLGILVPIKIKFE